MFIKLKKRQPLKYYKDLIFQYTEDKIQLREDQLKRVIENKQRLERR